MGDDVHALQLERVKQLGDRAGRDPREPLVGFVAQLPALAVTDAVVVPAQARQISEVRPSAVLGVLSLVFWSLTAVVAVKYLTFVMRADNQGEGGILALLALVPEKVRSPA